MDRPGRVVGGAPGPVVAEDLGFEVIEGARARHCRTFIDGPTALSAVPAAALARERGADRTCRPTCQHGVGELDWWVFADGQLGRAAIEVSGLRSDAWSAPGRDRGDAPGGALDVTDRTRPVDVSGPVDATAPEPSRR